MAGVTPEVLEQLEALSNQRESREGWFTTREIVAALDVNEAKARDMLREMLQAGRIDTGHIPVGPEDGYLRSTKIQAYRLRDAA